MIKQVWKVESTGQIFEDKNKALLACLLYSSMADKIMFKDKAIFLDMIPKYFEFSPKEELFRLAGLSSIKKESSDSITKIGQGFTEIKDTKNTENLINWVD